MSEPLLESPPKEQLLTSYEAGAGVLEGEAESIQSAVKMLSSLSDDIISGEAEAATEHSLATSAVDVLPMIQQAVIALTPKQTDPEATATQRWTMNWKELSDHLKSLKNSNPELAEGLDRWFLESAANMVDTTYGTVEAKKPLKIVVAGANAQCRYRPVLVMASMASPEFRAAHGLVGQEEQSLNGEEERNSGWLKDSEFVLQLREHVKARIEAGEIQPNLLVLGSGERKLLREQEINIVSEYLDMNIELLYPERGLTEADAMLAGALKTFGGQVSTVEITDIPSSEPDGAINKLISFDSELGKVEFVATVGADANLLRQVTIACQKKPELIRDIDVLQGATTAIYTWVQRPILREAASLLGLKDIAVEALGISAHAAGMGRDQATLVGEITNYLKAIYGVATRMLEAAELNIQSDIRSLGGTAISGVNG